MIDTSQSLLERLRDPSDRAAWQRLLAVYEPWLRGWLSRHPLQPADADDLVQEILVVVSQKLATFQHNSRPGAFRAWLRSILTNQVRHFLRGQRQRQALLSPATPGDWVEQLEDENSALSRQWDQEHDQQLVRRLLASLQPEFNPITWQIFQMLVLEDQPVVEVARRFNLKPNAVYVAKARVLGRLRRELRGLMEV